MQDEQESELAVCAASITEIFYLPQKIGQSMYIAVSKLFDRRFRA